MRNTEWPEYLICIYVCSLTSLTFLFKSTQHFLVRRPKWIWRKFILITSDIESFFAWWPSNFYTLCLFISSWIRDTEAGKWWYSIRFCYVWLLSRRHSLREEIWEEEPLSFPALIINVSTLMLMSFYSTCTFLTDMALVTQIWTTILKPDTALLDAGTQETTTVSYDMLWTRKLLVSLALHQISNSIFLPFYAANVSDGYGMGGMGGGYGMGGGMSRYWDH